MGKPEPARPASVPAVAAWHPGWAVWLARWTDQETGEERWSAWTPGGVVRRVALPDGTPVAVWIGT
jgi:hypothetical protein